MTKKLIFTFATAGLMILTGCSKKMGQFKSDYFSVNPTPLAVVGEQVPATVTGNIPSKFFVKNAEVTITPYLVYGSQEEASTPYTVQGEKVRGNNPVVSYENGGTVTVPVNYSYKPEMINSDLWLGFKVQQGSKTYALPRVKVDNGINSTATLADAATVTPAVAPDKFQRVINEKYSADIKFLINQTNIRASELQQAGVKDLHKTIKEAQKDKKKEVEGINISSYASPEGGVKLNTRIAEGREKNTKSYLNDELKKNKIDEAGDLTADFTPQDWEGFQKLVAQSNIQDKNLILSVLSMYKDPETREREIRNLSSVFDQLAKEVLPKLRYSRLTASINTIGKSDEEMKAAYESDPKTLTVDELLYYANTLNDNNDRMAAYKTCTETYPNDYRGYNNLGLCQYKAKNYTDAKANFEKAASMNPQSNEAKMNLGLCSLLDKNYTEANQKLGSAAGVPELNDALGVYYLKTGDYNAAVRAFGETKSNNSALAQILTKDYSTAKNTLASIVSPDATTYYLMAILGARTNNETMVTSNLRQAVKMDSSLAKKAKNDLEFTKFNLSSVI
jgi:tetratricopeptide (TPR) repeat protein